METRRGLPSLPNGGGGSYRAGMRDTFDPRAGGVKIVFDVLEADVDDVAMRVAAAGFDARRYYPDDEQRQGGPGPGYIRLGAERAMTAFTETEIGTIIAEFDATQAQTGFACLRIGTDTWTAGGDSPAGDREPREPLPPAGVRSAAARRRGVATASY